MSKTTVEVTYLPFSPTYPPMPCRITIYTATAPRHPLEAKISKRTGGAWEGAGSGLVNDYLIGTQGTTTGEQLRFEFDCPAPNQFWEIHIQTPPFSPFPNFLDSMIGSCENRGFQIAYPGGISRAQYVPPQSAAEVLANYVAKPAAVEGTGPTA